MTEKTEFERRGDVGVITLNRPQQLNALDPQMLEELVETLAAVAASSAKALVLTGSGRLFSAGVDLSTPFFMENVDDPSVYSGKRLLDSQHRVIRAIFDLPVPTLAAMNGHAVGGGGFGLAMACDIRFAVRGARMWMVPGALDVVQDFGLSWLVQRVIGPSRAFHMALTGYQLPTEEAAQWGLVNELHDDAAALASRVDAFIAQINGMGGDAVRMLKTVLRLGETSNLKEQLEVEAIANGLAFQSDEFKARKAEYLEAKNTKGKS